MIRAYAAGKDSTAYPPNGTTVTVARIWRKVVEGGYFD